MPRSTLNMKISDEILNNSIIIKIFDSLENVPVLLSGIKTVMLQFGFFSGNVLCKPFFMLLLTLSFLPYYSGFADKMKLLFSSVTTRLILIGKYLCKMSDAVTNQWVSNGIALVLIFVSLYVRFDNLFISAILVVG